MPRDFAVGLACLMACVGGYVCPLAILLVEQPLAQPTPKQPKRGRLVPIVGAC